MSLHAGPLVMVDIEGTRLDAGTAAFLREQRIRAVCLFRKNFGSETEVRALIKDLHAVLGPRALVAMDQEGGAVVRATFLPQPPSAMALGAAADEALAFEVGAATGRGLRSIGVNWNFAPVLDVNNNPANPVIGERSFGEDPAAVARLAGAWMRGSLGEGVACCVKHFPGHGDTHTDSHHALPAVDKPLAALEALELVPFAALIDAPALMTAHIVYPQIDPELPATLSRTWLTGVLREHFSYRGVVITDALMMQAVRDRWGHAKAAVLALDAGADMVLAQGSRDEQQATLDAIGDALASERLQPMRLAASRERLDALASRFPAVQRDYPQRRADEALMADAWARGLTVLRGAVPPPRTTPLRVIGQARVDSDGVSEAGLALESLQSLFDGFADVQWCAVESLLEAGALPPPDGRFTVLLGNHRQRYRQAAAERLRPDLHIALWNPYQALDIAGPTVLSWGFAPGALAALRAWLHGGASAPGKPPITLEESHR